jgi:purine-binding chemotaxis protein CheW
MTLPGPAGSDNKGNVNGERLEIVVCQLADEYFGIDINNIEEIKIPTVITPVPLTSDFVIGITGLRGTLFPVIRPAKIFNLPILRETVDSRIIIFRLSDEMIGFFVDRVIGVHNYTREEILPYESTNQSMQDYFHGAFHLNEEFVAYLNLPALLASPMLGHFHRGKVMITAK